MFESCNVLKFLDRIDMYTADLLSQFALHQEGSEIIIKFKHSTLDDIVKQRKLLSMKTNASGGQWPDAEHPESSLKSAQEFFDSAAGLENSVITFETCKQVGRDISHLQTFCEDISYSIGQHFFAEKATVAFNADFVDAGHEDNPFCVITSQRIKKGYPSYAQDPGRLIAGEVTLLRELWASYDNVQKIAQHCIITNFKKGITFNAPVPRPGASHITPGRLGELVDAGGTFFEWGFCRPWVAAYQMKFGWEAKSRMISNVRAAYRAAIQQ